MRPPSAILRSRSPAFCSSAARAPGSGRRRRSRASAAERSPRSRGRAWDGATSGSPSGKASDALPLPFPIRDDGCDVRAALAGLVAGVRAARNDVVVALPVDTPLITDAALQLLAAACAEAAVPASGPLPGAYRRAALPVLERRLHAGQLKLRRAVAELDARIVDLDPALLVNVNRLEDLQRIKKPS